MTDVIVISTKPGKTAAYYAEILADQTAPVNRLILVRAPGCGAETDAFEAKNGAAGHARAHRIPVSVVSSVFDAPGYMLTQGVKASDADTFLFLHEDVTRLSQGLLEALAHALDGDTAMAFARTLPGEKQVRIRDAYQAFYNPAVSEERNERTLFKKGYLQFVTGDSAVLLTRAALKQAGGFESETLVSPFSMIAAELFYQKKKLHYEAKEAAVRKPDSASPAAVFRSAFDLSAGMQAHAQTFGLYHKYFYKDEKLHKHPVILMSRPAMYSKKLGFSARMLTGAGRIYKVPGLFCLYLLELAANLLGSRFQLLPVKLSRAMSGHRSWFSD